VFKIEALPSFSVIDEDDLDAPTAVGSVLIWREAVRAAMLEWARRSDLPSYRFSFGRQRMV
jgi:hypothetical protein